MSNEEVTENASAAGSGAPYAAAVEIARTHADDVDRKARFPEEAVNALREAHMLSGSLPASVGGRDMGIAQLAAAARALGAACSSTAMVFAMHHTQALVIARYGVTGPSGDVARTIAANESLLASATTEITTGGDLGSSTCAVTRADGMVRLEKNAPVISYGEYADYVCATARRTPESVPSDQVLLLCPRESTRLDRTSTWDVLGFRGTCSPGFMLSTEVSEGHLVPIDYASALGTTMLPVSHTLWSSVWLGMADAAVAKARAAVRQATRRAGHQPEDLTLKLADLVQQHQEFEYSVESGVRRYEAFLDSGAIETTIGFTLAMNNLKVTSSTSVLQIVGAAMLLIGLNAYRDDHPMSLGRLLRDSYAPSLMVSNDRIRKNNARLVLAHRG